MCGRYTLTSPLDSVANLFDLESGLNLGPRYNIAPTQDVPVVRRDDDHQRELVQLRWGLIPSWAKEMPRAPLINARAETVAEKPSFRTAFRKARCLVPSDGFYEWRTTGKKGAPKTPYHVKFRSGELMIFGGIWEHWRGPAGEAIDSMAMLTTSANNDIAEIHHRMPVIVAPENFDTWLNADAELEEERLRSLMAPFPDGFVEAIEISTRVNSVTYDDPECQTPVANTGGLF